MKKVLSILTAGVFLAGALAVFAGCDTEIKDEALTAEIFAAIEEAQFQQIEIESELEVDYTISDTGVKVTGNVKQEGTAKMYEEDGKLFGDVFTDNYAKTETNVLGIKMTDTQESFTVQFSRNSETYSLTDEWKNVKAKKGNFESLIEALKKENVVLEGSTELPSLSLDEGDVQSFGELARETDAKVYKHGSGYSVELDAEKVMKKEGSDIFDELTSGAGFTAVPKVNGEIVIVLDEALNVTSVDAEIKFTVAAVESTTSLKMTGELTMELEALEEAPKLADLTGIRADMGYQFMPMEYELTEATVLISTQSQDFEAVFNGTVTVMENNYMSVDVTLELQDGTVLTDWRHYNLNESNFDIEDLYYGWLLDNDERVTSGVYYDLSISPESGGHLTVLSDEIDFPCVQLVKNL